MAAFTNLHNNQNISSATGTVTQVDTGTGLTGGPITTTGTVSLDTKLAPLDTLTGNALKVPRVNAGETALEYVTPAAGTVTSVSGTTNRVTSTGGATPVIDISATFEALLGKVASPLSQFASTTSSQLAGVISDETGTGVLVYNNKPTFLGTIQTITAVAALALDGSLGNMFTKTIGTGSTFTQSNFTVGQNFMVTVSGAFTITWFSGITWISSGGTVPTQGAITTYGFTCTGSNTFNGYLVGTQ